MPHIYLAIRITSQIITAKLLTGLQWRWQMEQDNLTICMIILPYSATTMRNGKANINNNKSITQQRLHDKKTVNLFINGSLHILQFILCPGMGIKDLMLHPYSCFFCILQWQQTSFLLGVSLIACAVSSWLQPPHLPLSICLLTYSRLWESNRLAIQSETHRK